MSHLAGDVSCDSPAGTPTKAAKAPNGAAGGGAAGAPRLRRTRSESLSLEFPPFVRVEREVTGEREFSAYHLSLRASAGGPAGDEGPLLRAAADDGPCSTPPR